MEEPVNDDVGYKKPPVSGRIKPGERRNPNGRRGKKTKPEATSKPETDMDIIARLDSELIEANGVSMSRREVELRVLSNKAMKGDVRASQHLDRVRAKAPANTPAVAGGVLLLPSPVPLHEWEASAAIQQAQFRERKDDGLKVNLEAKDRSDEG